MLNRVRKWLARAEIAEAEATRARLESQLAALDELVALSHGAVCLVDQLDNMFRGLRIRPDETIARLVAEIPQADPAVDVYDKVNNVGETAQVVRVEYPATVLNKVSTRSDRTVTALVDAVRFIHYLKVTRS